jgi:DNA-binding transcriptional ArsR family regulator
MDEGNIAERMTLSKLDQLRVIADPYRLNILRMLQAAPATTKMLADRIGDVPGKVHYHVRELERLGLIHLVHKQEKGGVVEKYYRAIARVFEPDPSLLRLQDEQEVPHHVALVSRMRDEFIAVTDQRLRAEEQAGGRDDAESAPEPMVSFDVGDQFYLTDEQVKELHSFITNMLEDARKSDKEGVPSKQRYTIGLFIYPTPMKNEGV